MRIIVNKQRMVEALAHKGLNANSFAKLFNVSVPTSYRIFSGKAAPSPRIAKLIAENLEVPFEELFSVEV